MKSNGPAVVKKQGDGRLACLWCWVVLALIIIGAAAIRARLLSMPLERDEGEYAYIAQQMLKGVPPYESGYSMKLPGIYAVYALFFVVFGQTIEAIRTGLIIFNSVTILILFLLTRRLFGQIAGVAAAAAYAIMSLARSVDGLSANAEHFVVLPVLIGMLLISRPSESPKLLKIFCAAIMFGSAFIIKQHGIFFAVFAAVYLLYSDLRYRRFQLINTIRNQLVFIAGAALPFVLVCLFYRHIGVFDKFWFWTFTYAGKYTTSLALADILKNFLARFGGLVYHTIPVWPVALFGILRLFLDKTIRPSVLFVAGFLMFSFISVCPGFYFREHYFILFLPAAAILAGAGFDFLANMLAGRMHRLEYGFVVVLAGLMFSGYLLYDQRKFLFEGDANQVCRRIYTGNPFPESVEVAKYIKQRSSPDDTIAVIGSEPQIYFYADRRAATKYIYVYPLTEIHDYAAEMQKEMISQVETVRPEFVVLVNVRSSWLNSPGTNKFILDLVDSYVPKYYDLVGIADIISENVTIYRWDKQVVGYKPSSECYLLVFKRKQ
jgi:hypothetical protein